MYGVRFKSTSLLKLSLVTAAAMLTIGLLTLVEAPSMAEATTLPENGRIAFSQFNGMSEADEIYTIEPDGSNLRRLTNSPSYTYNTRPIWSPDGKHIIFNHQGPEGKLCLKIMRADGSNVRSLPCNAHWGSDVTWLPDGTKLAFGGDDIVTMDLDGSDRINLTRTPGIGESYPSFSPDGSQMCFFRFTSTQQPVPDIYAMSVDGSDPTLLVEGDSQEILDVGIPTKGCEWSPDGKKIAFHAIIPGPAEGDLRKALKRAIAEADPEKILEKQRKLRAELDEEVYVINADGSGLTNLTDNPASDLNADWSPDGTKITFVSNRDGVFNMYTMDADGSDVAEVSTNLLETNYDDPDWQPLPGSTLPKDADGSDVDQGPKKPAMEDVDRDRPERTVIIKPGDSLWSISEQRLGPEASPQRVYDHTYQMYALNRKIIGSDPDLIFAGQRFSLPPR